MVIQKSKLSEYISSNILIYISREYKLEYDHFAVYKGNSPVEYRVTFPSTDKIIIIRAYFKEMYDMIDLESISIQSTDPRDSLYISELKEDNIKNLQERMIYINNLLFKENTL